MCVGAPARARESGPGPGGVRVRSDLPSASPGLEGVALWRTIIMSRVLDWCRAFSVPLSRAHTHSSQLNTFQNMHTNNRPGPERAIAYTSAHRARRPPATRWHPRRRPLTGLRRHHVSHGHTQPNLHSPAPPLASRARACAARPFCNLWHRSAHRWSGRSPCRTPQTQHLVPLLWCTHAHRAELLVPHIEPCDG